MRRTENQRLSTKWCHSFYIERRHKVSIYLSVKDILIYPILCKWSAYCANDVLKYAKLFLLSGNKSWNPMAVIFFKICVFLTIGWPAFCGAGYQHSGVHNMQIYKLKIFCWIYKRNYLRKNEGNKQTKFIQIFQPTSSICDSLCEVISIKT